MKKLLFIIVIVGGVALAFFVLQTKKEAPHQVTNFEECAALGNPIMESYPRQCRYGGKTFTEVVAETFRVPEGQEGAGILPFNSGISGAVLLGPTCPVMRNPPDPTCADKPYHTTIQIIAAHSARNAPFATVETDKEGKYTAMLPPGDYGVQAVSGAVFPRCESKEITVEPNTMHTVNLSCDTGIR